MRRPVAVALALAGALIGAGAAGEAASSMPMGTTGYAMSSVSRMANVTLEFAAYQPPQINVLTGDTVLWSDVSRTHTVTAQDGSFSSPHLSNGDTFSHQFTASGKVSYYCQIHSFMHGEVDVYDVLLDPATVPTGPGKPFPLRGRSSLPQGTPISIEGDSGSGFAPVGSALVGSDGTFTSTVMPRTTTTYRAVAGTGQSPPVIVRVVDSRVLIGDRRRGGVDVVSVRVTPPSPGATVVLQLNLRERFGWWPELRSRLDRSSRARFRIALDRRVPARVALTLPDGYTQLALSPALRIGR